MDFSHYGLPFYPSLKGEPALFLERVRLTVGEDDARKEVYHAFMVNGSTGRGLAWQKILHPDMGKYYSWSSAFALYAEYGICLPSLGKRLFFGILDTQSIVL